MAGKSAAADLSRLKKALENEESRVIAAVVNLLARVGEEARNAAVDTALQVKPYKDQTRHLRGSTGYIITVDGKVEVVGAFGAEDSNPEGKAQGERYARSLAGEFPKGIALILVAGKEYASYVANRGYDVLDSAEITAREMVPKALEMVERLLAEEEGQ